MKMIRNIVTNIIDWFLYSVLNEKQKEKLTNLFSDELKEKIKKLTQYGKKHSQKMKVKQIKDNLYSLGLTVEALREFHDIYKHGKDKYVKRLVAWELTLWYANQYTEEDAKRALQYIDGAKQGEKDVDQLRRIAIMEAECLAQIGKKDEARNLLQENLSRKVHPDLYLALANLEDEVEKRLYWINKVYSHFQLNPITFTNLNEPNYDSLQMKKWDDKKHEEGKVTVILPAYNAEDGIQIAVESILSQTWRNLELIIVDDCSTDRTFEVAKRYAEKDERVKVFSTPKNSGPYVARNIALQAATGDFVTVNDADDWSHEKKLEIQVRHLLNNPSVIANTSSHARLTEDLYLYRRGTPGKYLFPNMSSIMFRRKEVMEKLGFWDSVRFAADGEFKRRLIKTFGKEKYVDLETGPLSLPRQSVSSLTSSSAFGYNGFFMGARKEYVESLEFFHQKNDFYYPYPQTSRPFPVPEPMWPQKEEKSDDGKRFFDLVIAADFRSVTHEKDFEWTEVKRSIEMIEGRIGLVQLYQFDLTLPIHISPIIRELIDGDKVQMLVYGEKIATDKLLILDYNLIGIEQKYVPEIFPKQVDFIVREQKEDVERMYQKIKKRFDVKTNVIPVNQEVRIDLEQSTKKETRALISNKDWVKNDG